MQYVTSIERMAIQKGREEGLEEGLQVGIKQSIVNVLQARFGLMPTTAAGRLEQVDDLEQLQSYLRQAATVNSLAAFEALLADLEQG